MEMIMEVEVDQQEENARCFQGFVLFIQLKIFSRLSSTGFGAPYSYTPAGALPAYGKNSLVNNPSIKPVCQHVPTFEFFLCSSSGFPSRMPSVVVPVIRVPTTYPVTHLYPY